MDDGKLAAMLVRKIQPIRLTHPQIHDSSGAHSGDATIATQ